MLNQPWGFPTEQSLLDHRLSNHGEGTGPESSGRELRHPREEDPAIQTQGQVLEAEEKRRRILQNMSDCRKSKYSA